MTHPQDDFGASVIVTRSPWTRADTGRGATVAGASNVLTLSIAAAVSISPDAEPTLTPTRLVATSAARVGSRFVSESQIVPDASLAAMTSTRGSVIVPCAYRPASYETGTNVASWNGTYIRKT